MKIVTISRKKEIKIIKSKYDLRSIKIDRIAPTKENYKKSSSYIYSKIYSIIPEDIREQKSKNSYKKELKKWILTNDNIWDQINTYVC